MLLKNLINRCPQKYKKINIKGIASDSRKTKKNFIFFALTGTKQSGDKFIKDAVKKGAVAVICKKNFKSKISGLPLIKVKNVQRSLAEACEKFFKEKPARIIAVTGTNGKSSVANFFLQIFNFNNIAAASIGTLGVMQKNRKKPIGLTTPDIISLHKELNDLKRKGINNVILEASSHGLAQGRLDGIKYKAGIFTNFSLDHLDFHKNIKNYFNSKMILFNKLLNKNSYVISDSKINHYKILMKSIKNSQKLIDINNQLYKNYNFKKNFNLKGNFQYKNLMMAIIAANICGLSFKKINNVIKKIKPVNGRLELIKTLSNNAKIYIDYAHTPDALESVIRALKENNNKKLSLVFGCGGERDKSKRKQMAIIAKKYCNKIYVTDDNPRKENPNKIRKDIIKFINSKSCFNIGNREKAINKAMNECNNDELILIAGKGHENQQDYGNKILNISDKKIVKKIRIKKNFYNSRNYNINILNSIIKRKINFHFKGVSIDSRTCKKNNLFIALKGKNKNGNDFIYSAQKKGVSLCIGNKKIKQKKYIHVNNSFKFLEKFASLKRLTFSAKIVAITGSAGKTTLKFMLGKILKCYGKSYFPPKSFNNNIGVPLSLSNLEHDHKFGVFEIGMNKPGEINSLSKIVKPDIAVITNVAEAHIENFKNLLGIAKEKSSIIQNINDGGTIILNRSDRFFKLMLKQTFKKNLKVITFGNNKNADIFPIKKNLINGVDYFKISFFNEVLIIKSNGSKILNILACLAVLKSLDLDIGKIKDFFLNFNSIEGRGKIFKIKMKNKAFKLIDESYNANPLSVKEAINNLSKIKTLNNSKKYILLGDMLELGKKSRLYHRQLSKYINNANINKFFAIGNRIIDTYRFVKRNKRGNILHSEKDFEDVVQPILKQNDYLMIKGSNATGLNMLSKRLIRGFGHAL